MQKFIFWCERYAATVVRLGIGAVVLWFGLQQLLHPADWTAYIPDSIVALTHVSALTLVHLNSAFELVFSILLIIGWQTRIVALLIALHLFDIMWTVGYGEIGVRDFGLALMALSVFMRGSDRLCVDYKPVISQHS